MLDQLEVAVVGLQVITGGRDSQLPGQVLQRRVHAVGLRHGLRKRILHAQALNVLPVVGPEGIEQVVLVDELAVGVERRAAEARRAPAPVVEATVDLARRVKCGTQGHYLPMPGRRLGAQDRRARAVGRGGPRHERERERGHHHAPPHRCARTPHPHRILRADRAPGAGRGSPSKRPPQGARLSQQTRAGDRDEAHPSAPEHHQPRAARPRPVEPAADAAAAWIRAAERARPGAHKHPAVPMAPGRGRDQFNAAASREDRGHPARPAGDAVAERTARPADRADRDAQEPAPRVADPDAPDIARPDRRTARQARPGPQSRGATARGEHQVAALEADRVGRRRVAGRCACPGAWSRSKKNEPGRWVGRSVEVSRSCSRWPCGELVGGRPDLDVVVVEAARLDRLRVGVRVVRALRRALGGVERAVRGAQRAVGDDRLAAVGGDVGELGVPVGVGRASTPRRGAARAGPTSVERRARAPGCGTSAPAGPRAAGRSARTASRGDGAVLVEGQAEAGRGVASRTCASPASGARSPGARRRPGPSSRRSSACPRAASGPRSRTRCAPWT